MSKIETRVTDINLSRLKQFSKLFGVSTRSLLDEDPLDVEKDEQILQLESDLKVANVEIMELQRRLIRFLPESQSNV